MIDWSPLLLSAQLATVTTLVLALIGVPLAAWLADTRSKLRPVIEAIVGLPLVLPPTVLGFYLLVVWSPAQAPGSWLSAVHLELLFSFEGLVLGSVIYSLPFMVQPLQAGLRNLPGRYQEAAYSMGKSYWQTLFVVLLPNCKPALLTAVVLSFAHTVGEFGLVLMIGGNIPGDTRVASIAIYDAVESLQYGTAHTYAAILLAFTFITLLTVYSINQRNPLRT